MQSLVGRRQRWGRVALALAVWIGTAIAASAQAVGPEIPIWIGSSVSENPRIEFDADHGEFLVVWSNQQATGTQNVTARRVGLDGSLGPSFPIVSVVDEVHRFPVLAYNSHHAEYLVVWEHWVPSTVADWDVMGSLVSWDGAVVGNPFVIGSGFEYHFRADVAVNPNDDEYLVVSWDVGPGWQDIYARRLDWTGASAGTAVVTTSANGEAGRPHVTFSPENAAYLIGYSNLSPSTGHRVVVGKIAPPDLAGVSGAPEIIIADDPIEDAQFPVVAGSAVGFVSVCNLSVDTMARRLAPDGAPLGPAGGFPLGNQDNQAILSSTRPNAVSRSDAVGYVAAWHQLMPTAGDVYAQAVSATADSVVSNTFAVADSAADEREVDVACSPSGDCLVVYQRDENIIGRTLHLRIFSDGFESGNAGAWIVPDRFR